MCRLTGDWEVAGSAPADGGNILSWRLIMKHFLWSFLEIDHEIFSMVILSLPQIQEG